jgi:hypothetical protein
MPVYDCFLCDLPFQFGPQAYHGRHIGSWGVEICDNCLRGNWDGIVPQQNPRLLEHLRANGTSIALNPKGLLDIPSH